MGVKNGVKANNIEKKLITSLFKQKRIFMERMSTQKRFGSNESSSGHGKMISNDVKSPMDF